MMLGSNRLPIFGIGIWIGILMSLPLPIFWRVKSSWISLSYFLSNFRSREMVFIDSSLELWESESINDTATSSCSFNLTFFAYKSFWSFLFCLLSAGFLYFFVICCLITVSYSEAFLLSSILFFAWVFRIRFLNPTISFES